MSASSTAWPNSSLAAGTHPFLWSVRRELWEYRSIYVAPAAVAGVFLFGFLFQLFSLPETVRRAMSLGGVEQRNALVQPYDFAAGAIMLVAFLVAGFYCIDCLYGERRDRSMLFWKSMPVSDTTAVLAKASVPLVVVPTVIFALTLVTQTIMLVLSTIVLAANGMNVADLWRNVALFPSVFLILYHLVTVHVLWYAPIYCWLLLVSAWSRRAPLVWAVLPPLVIGIFEKLVFHTSHFGSFIGSRFAGGPEMDPSSMNGTFPFHPGLHLTPGHLLIAPGLWGGLLFAALFLSAAIYLRRYRDPV